MSVVKSIRKSLKRWIGGAAAAAALSVVGVLAVAAPASAAPSDCQNGRTCVWNDDNYSTFGFGNIQYSYENGINKFQNYYWGVSGTTLNDNVTSVYNNGNQQRSYLYYDNYFKGTQAASLAIKQGIANLGTHNDKASSGGFLFCVQNPYSSICG